MVNDEVTVGGIVFKTNPVVISMSREAIQDTEAVQDLWARVEEERRLDAIHGPRYGPPIPPEPEERCPTCGQVIDE